MISRRGDDGPSVNIAFPPVGWHSTLKHAPQKPAVCACEKTVVIVKQPMCASHRKHPVSSKEDKIGSTWGFYVHELVDCSSRLSLWG
jgi:hypothetical protein